MKIQYFSENINYYAYLKLIIFKIGAWPKIHIFSSFQVMLT